MSRKVAAFFYFVLAMVLGGGSLLKSLGVFPPLDSLDSIWGGIVVLLIFAVILALWVLRRSGDSSK